MFCALPVLRKDLTVPKKRPRPGVLRGSAPSAIQPTGVGAAARERGRAGAATVRDAGSSGTGGGSDPSTGRAGTRATAPEFSTGAGDGGGVGGGPGSPAVPSGSRPSAPCWRRVRAWRAAVPRAGSGLPLGAGPGRLPPTAWRRGIAGGADSAAVPPGNRSGILLAAGVWAAGPSSEGLGLAAEAGEFRGSTGLGLVESSAILPGGERTQGRGDAARRASGCDPSPSAAPVGPPRDRSASLVWRRRSHPDPATARHWRINASAGVDAAGGAPAAGCSRTPAFVPGGPFEDAAAGAAAEVPVARTGGLLAGGTNRRSRGAGGCVPADRTAALPVAPRLLAGASRNLLAAAGGRGGGGPAVREIVSPIRPWEAARDPRNNPRNRRVVSSSAVGHRH